MFYKPGRKRTGAFFPFPHPHYEPGPAPGASLFGGRNVFTFARWFPRTRVSGSAACFARRGGSPETLARSCWDPTDSGKMRESSTSAADWQVIEYVLCEGRRNRTRLVVAARVRIGSFQLFSPMGGRGGGRGGLKLLTSLVNVLFRPRRG